MVKTLVACTAEVDDAKRALDEIKSQLQLETKLMKNSIGIIACHYEFIDSGVYQAVCDELPFDVVGTVSSSQSVLNNADSLLMTIMLITSDDTEFVNVLTPSLVSEPGKVISESYKQSAAARPQKPALVLAFAPFMIQNSGDEYVNVISDISDGVPCFGTIAVDDTPDLSSCFMLSGGGHYSDQMAMVLVYGDINPKFYIANISEHKILDKSAALITKSAGHVIMEINGRSVDVFFEDLGLTQASETSYAMSSLPFLLDYNDGTPQVSKIFISLTPERYGLCAGAVPEGSSLQIASSDKEDVLFTTEQAVNNILQDIRGASGLLAYSCIGRSLSLGTDLYAEMNLLNDKVGDKLPFMMVCSGGEVCPTQTSSAKAINRFHNNAFVACLF